MANPVAGWYQDPSGDPTKLRWWDGTQWTDNYADAQPVSQPAAQQPYQQTPYQDPSAQPTYAQTQYTQTQTVNSTDQTLRLIAFILCILSAVSVLGDHSSGLDDPYDGPLLEVVQGRKGQYGRFWRVHASFREYHFGYFAAGVYEGRAVKLFAE